MNSTTPLTLLPRFTFLVGGEWKHNFDFAKLLQNKEPDPIIIHDMRQPLYEATSVLFTGGYDDVTTLESQEFLQSDIGRDAIEWLDQLETLVESEQRGTLGRLALEYINENEPDDVVIFLNATFDRIRPFLDDGVAPTDMLICICGTLPISIDPAFKSIRFLWLPLPEAIERERLLRRELGHPE